MGNAVAIAACWELRHHHVRMRYAMTILTSRNHLMLCFMTVCTGYILMLGRAGLEKAECHVVTGTAMFVAYVIRVFNRHRHMGLMTGQTISLYHIVGMGFMAGGTVWNLAMGSMTRGAWLLCMHCRDSL